MEPMDSAVGLAAAQMGCSVTTSWTPDGEGMAAMLNRGALVGELAEELRRRYQSALSWFASHAGQRDDVTIDRVIFGIAGCELIQDDGHLIRLLLGYWSWNDALAAGVSAPEHHYPVLRAVFPGSGMPWLPSPYAHRLDRY